MYLYDILYSPIVFKDFLQRETLCLNSFVTLGCEPFVFAKGRIILLTVNHVDNCDTLERALCEILIFMLE